MISRQLRWLLAFSVVMCACLDELSDKDSKDRDFDTEAPCADLDCEDAVTLHVARLDAQVFDPGRYVFAFGAESQTVSCDIPDKGPMQCAGGDDLLESSLNQTQDLITLEIRGAPESITIEVQQGDAVIGDEVLTPDYKVVTSENPHCLERCRDGKASIAVEAAPQI